MLGLGLALSIAKKTLGDAIDGLLSTLSGRATYYENGSASKSTIKAIDNADVLDKATILLTPTATSDARVHSVKTYTGDELVTNGGFDTDSDWSKGTGWSVSGGSANYDDTTNGQLSQAISLNVGNYKLSFNISNSSNSGARIWIGNNIGNVSYTDGTYEYYTNGNYSLYITVPSNQTTLAFWGNTGGSSFSIDNVSLTDASSDFIFDRASSATRINSSGLVQDMQSITDPELVLNGTFDTDSDWSKGTGWSIANGEAILTNGSGSLSKSDGILEVGKTYEFSIEITSISAGAFSPKTNTGQNIFDSVTINTVGVHTSTFTVTGGVNLQIRASGTTTGSIDNVSVKDITFSTDVDLARINYDSNGENGHILLEPTSTNLFPYSEDFSNSGWTKQSNITPTYNTTETLSPDGTYNATKFVGNGSDGVYKTNISITGVVTRSVYLKSVTGNINVKLKDPNFTITTKTLNVTTEWQRFELSEDNTTSLQGIWIDDIPSSGIYIWGAQLEALSYATSYIPTLTGSTVTRATETLTGSGNSTLINSTEGVLYAEIAALNDDISQQIGIYGNSTSKQLRIEIANSVIRGQLFNGAFQANMSSTQTVKNFNKVAFKWKADDFALWINGTEVATDSSGTTFSANDLDRVHFSGQNGSTSAAQAKVKALTVFNEALSDTELENLTS